MAEGLKTKKKKVILPVEEIRISINSSFNNTIITASGYRSGEVLAWSSSGQVGFNGTKKGTPYAATMAAKTLLTSLEPFKPSIAHLNVVGAGNGRDAALRAITASGLKIVEIKDITPLPHNGCRPKKARRV